MNDGFLGAEEASRTGVILGDPGLEGLALDPDLGGAGLVHAEGPLDLVEIVGAPRSL